MPLSLQDIQDKQFHVRFRGFDIEEVDGFLELIGENYSNLIDDNKKMRGQIESLTQELERVKNQESSFRNAIISAQKIADEMRKKSRDEANNLLSKAHEEIKALKDEAHREVTELESRVEQLKGMQVRFEHEIKTVIAAYQKSLEEIPKVSKEDYLPGEDSEIDLAEMDEKLLDKKLDFSDLYEKIDLGDDLAPAGMESGAVEDDEGVDPADVFLTREDGAKIPDLDGDVMFTLHDPLDDEEIGVDVPITTGKDRE